MDDLSRNTRLSQCNHMQCVNLLDAIHAHRVIHLMTCIRADVVVHLMDMPRRAKRALIEIIMKTHAREKGV